MSFRGRRLAWRGLLPVACALAVLACVELGALNGAGPSAASATGGFRFTVPGRVDIGFAQAMVEHHQQAVTLSEILLQGHGVPGTVRGLASSIQVVQLQEIGEMQGWLALWDAPPMPSGSLMAWMPSTSMAGPMAGMSASGSDSGATSSMNQMPGGPLAAQGVMPGMATQGELNLMAKMSGRRLAVTFLQLMLRHHEAGVEMARYAATHARVPQVRAVAAQMVIDQSEEIAEMSELLRADRAQPLPFG